MRVLRGSRATVTVTLEDENGDPVTSSTPVTVDVTNDLGVPVVTDGTATDPAAGEYAYSFVLEPTVTASVDVLTVEWTGTVDGVAQTFVTQVEVVGGFFAPLSAIRGLKDLDSEARFPVSALRDARDVAEATIQRATGAAYVPRYARVNDRTGHGFILGPLHARRVLGAFVDDVAQDVTEWEADDDGTIWYPATTTEGRARVAVEHGYDRPPADVRDAFLTYVRFLLLEDFQDLQARATSLSTEFGTFAINQAGAKAPTGVPSVDAVLFDRDERVGSIA